MDLSIRELQTLGVSEEKITELFNHELKRGSWRVTGDAQKLINSLGRKLTKNDFEYKLCLGIIGKSPTDFDPYILPEPEIFLKGEVPSSGKWIAYAYDKGIKTNFAEALRGTSSILRDIISCLLKSKRSIQGLFEETVKAKSFHWVKKLMELKIDDNIKNYGVEMDDIGLKFIRMAGQLDVYGVEQKLFSKIKDEHFKALTPLQGLRIMSYLSEDTMRTLSKDTAEKLVFVNRFDTNRSGLMNDMKYRWNRVCLDKKI